jgi:hypothetical protein
MKEIYFTPSAILYSCVIVSKTGTYFYTYVATRHNGAQYTTIKKP